MGLLTKDQILKAKDLNFRDIEVPEWGGKVRVQVMSATVRDEFDSILLESSKTRMKNMRATFVSMCLVDEKGDRLFEAEDIEALGKKSAEALERVFDAAQELNGMGAGAVEEAEKN